MKRKLDENPKIRASKCRAAWLWNRDGDETKRRSRGSLNYLGRVKSAQGKRDGLNQTRQSSQPAQQELPLFIYINPTDVSILPAPSQMLNLTSLEDLYLPDRTKDRYTGMRDVKRRFHQPEDGFQIHGTYCVYMKRWRFVNAQRRW